MPDIQLPNHARAVVVGAGIAGCSVAYHLTKLGWRDIVVVDQGPLFETGGSTTHAPGGVFQINASKTMTNFAQYTIDEWSRLTLNGKPVTNPVGTLEVAWTSERWTDLKRKSGYALSWGSEAYLISTKEAQNLFPLLSDRILGALYVPSDIQTTATRPAEAMARAAEAKGATFHGNVEVTGYDIANGRIRGVKTSNGDIKTDIVVAAVGIWAPKLGGLAGVPIPLSPMQHIYAITGPLPELADETEEITLPLVRHQDRSMYFRQETESVGIGSYLHDPLVVDAYDILSVEDAPVAPAEMPFTPEHFDAALEAAGQVMPCLQGVELTRKFNGLFSFTPDGFPILGESPQLAGFWSAQAVWITHAGGVGKAVAEWIVDGEPSVDLRECDISRFQSHAYNPTYVRMKAAQQYDEVYDIIHPMVRSSFPRNLRLSPFYERQRELGAAFFEDAGWERPRWYTDNANHFDGQTIAGDSRSDWEAENWSPVIATEHVATRNGVAMFDATPFAKFEISGADALRALQHLTTNQLDNPVGSITYTPMLTPNGGIKADITVTRLAADHFLVITGGATGPQHLNWIRTQMPVNGSVTITDVTSSQCCVGLWGPHARHVLESVCEDDISNANFPYMTAKPINIHEVPALALRISYVGELGWEIYVPFECGQRLWDILWRAGEPFGIAAAGTGAFDSLRLEKGYRSWGTDIQTDYNPYEAGLGFTVKPDKGDFIGRDALVSTKASEITRRLSCITLDAPRCVVMGKEPILDGDRVIGYVTSANFGHSIGMPIAYGYLPTSHTKPGTEVDILYFGERLRGTVSSEPLYDPKGEKLKA